MLNKLTAILPKSPWIVHISDCCFIHSLLCTIASKINVTLDKGLSEKLVYWITLRHSVLNLTAGTNFTYVTGKQTPFGITYFAGNGTSSLGFLIDAVVFAMGLF